MDCAPAPAGGTRKPCLHSVVPESNEALLNNKLRYGSFLYPLLRKVPRMRCRKCGYIYGNRHPPPG